MGRKKGRGHFCWCCGAMRPNEAFSGGGHARHLCKQCAKLGVDELAYRQEVRNIDRLLDWDGLIRRKTRKPFQRYLTHSNPRVRAYATEVAARDVRKREERARERDALEMEPVSTPEMTAFDLVRYRKGAGSIDHIATVLAELGKRLNAKKLLTTAEKNKELPVIQRLGYLLERTGHGDLTEGLAAVVRAGKPKTIALEPKSSKEISERDAKWHLLVNTTIEVEA